jgi:hypothetical protein
MSGGVWCSISNHVGCSGGAISSPGSSHLAISQHRMPAIMEAIAPPEEAFFQYSPAIIGTNSDTKLNADDSPTNSYILLRIIAIPPVTKATPITERRIMRSSCRSVTPWYSGRTKFSPITVAGASNAPLAVLKIADSKAPKNRICIQMVEC